MEEKTMVCPCKKKNCPRHGNCGECKEFHRINSKYPPYCAQKGKKKRSDVSNQNRVSLSLTLLQSGGRIFLSAITSGGSQAVFWKINIFGEEAFLDTIRETVENYII